MDVQFHITPSFYQNFVSSVNSQKQKKKEKFRT